MEDIKTYALQSIVLPDGDFSEQEELFYREKDFFGELDGQMVQGHLCSFDTWMNLFAAEKWYQYCELGNLYLRIAGKGKCRLDILGHTLSVIHGVMSETMTSVACDLGEGGSMLVPVPAADEAEGISLRIFCEAGGFKMEEAAWCTDAAPQRQHRLAIACCTYKRERYVTKNIRKFQSLMAAHPELKGKLHMFVSDNGQSLPLELGDEHVDILPNMNAGGAGGFARGLMAANDGGYTRCIFMDDDVELCTEAFLRSLALCEYFKEEYKDAFVNGAMMNLFERNICSESITIRNAFWLKPYHGQVDVSDLYNTMKCLNVTEDIYEKTFVSSSWWFACFSLDLYRGEYPIPCFIRGDDCEWSWRRLGVQHVSLNGICVWHTPFDFNTRRMIDHYFLPRNMFLVHSNYNPDFKDEWYGYINGFFRHFMETYNYVSAELILSALREILKGWESFAEDPVRMMGRLQAICKKAEIKTCKNIRTLEDVRDIGSGGKSVGKKGIVVDWFPSENVFKDKKKVEAYNLVTRKCDIRRPNRLKQEWQEEEYDLQILRIQLYFDAIRDNLREGLPKLTNREFWDEYLELAETKGSVKPENTAEIQEVAVQEGIDLRVALEDAIIYMDDGSLTVDKLKEAMREAVRHQMVQALEHYFAENWQQAQDSTEAAAELAARETTLRVSATGIKEAASGMDYLLSYENAAKELAQWKKNDMYFLCGLIRFQQEHEVSEENVAFLRECLDEAAKMYSDFRNAVVADVR
ncbi:hypothetical protein [Selenomonas sp. KH1T6]|uniref:hypothetical protein n=1 Tax=Selenomonas sp. KH1T6 TaxID=3158784 RepID=UPI001587E27D